jgi:hypothetical protein
VRFAGNAYLSELTNADDPNSERAALFDLELDPGEVRDRLGPDADARSRSLARESARLLAEHLHAQELLRDVHGRSAAYVQPVGEDLTRELRALGYVEPAEDEARRDPND